MYVLIFPTSQWQFQNMKIGGFEDSRVKRSEARNVRKSKKIRKFFLDKSNSFDQLNQMGLVVCIGIIVQDKYFFN